MRSRRRNIVISIVLFVLVALAAWPAYVVANIAIGIFLGESSALDLWQHEPKRVLLASFIEGYVSSAMIALGLGLVAAIDFLVLGRNRLSTLTAGLLLPIACMSLAFVYYAEPMRVIAGFGFAGLLLWILFKFITMTGQYRGLE